MVAPHAMRAWNWQERCHASPARARRQVRWLMLFGLNCQLLIFLIVQTGEIIFAQSLVGAGACAVSKRIPGIHEYGLVAGLNGFFILSDLDIAKGEVAINPFVFRFAGKIRIYADRLFKVINRLLILLQSDISVSARVV